MLFAAVAVSRGLLETFAATGQPSADSETYAVGRAMEYHLKIVSGPASPDRWGLHSPAHLAQLRIQEIGSPYLDDSPIPRSRMAD